MCSTRPAFSRACMPTSASRSGPTGIATSSSPSAAAPSSTSSARTTSTSPWQQRLPARRPTAKRRSCPRNCGTCSCATASPSPTSPTPAPPAWAPTGTSSSASTTASKTSSRSTRARASATRASTHRSPPSACATGEEYNHCVDRRRQARRRPADPQLHREEQRPVSKRPRARPQARRLGRTAITSRTHTSYGGVYVKDFTREGIIEGLNARRTIAATDKIFVEFTCNGHLLGTEIEVTGKPVLDMQGRRHRRHHARDPRAQRTELPTVGTEGEDLRAIIHRRIARRRREPLLPPRRAEPTATWRGVRRCGCRRSKAPPFRFRPAGPPQSQALFAS